MFLFLLLLAGCAPAEVVRDASCVPATQITVVRVMNDMILGWMDKGIQMDVYAPTAYYHPADEHYIYLKRDPHQIYYPGQVLRLPDSTCIKYAGSYSYTVNNQYGAKTLKGALEPAQSSRILPQ